MRQQRRIHGIQRLKINIPRDTLIRIIERAIVHMNQKQREQPTIRTMFQKTNQDPHTNCDLVFKEHLDSLSQDSMYRTLFNNQNATVLDNE